MVNIIVTLGMDRDMTPYAQRASALITEEGGLTSSGAIIGLSLGLPTIVGANDCTKEIKTGDIITVDIPSGQVFKGSVENV